MAREAPLGPGKAAEGASGTPSARGPGGAAGNVPPRRARRAYALGDVYTSGAAIYTSRRGARPGARPEEGARRAAAKAQSGTGRNAHPNQAPTRRGADTTADTRPTKNALATPEGVEGDASQKLPHGDTASLIVSAWTLRYGPDHPWRY